MRVFMGGVLTETNTFSPIPVGLDAFERQYQSPVLAAAQELAPTLGFECKAGLFAFAPPGGPVRIDAYETLRDALLDDLRGAMPVDAVALDLHGAMIAFGYEDCEGDLLRRVREIVGPRVPVGALLDPHGHLSAAMIEHATLLCCYHENPHTDMRARAVTLIRLLLDAAHGRSRPVMSVFDCHQADVFQTNREPMRGFVERMQALCGRGPILDLSVVHGFRRADIPDMGAKVIAVTDAAPAEGARVARALGLELVRLRGQCYAPGVPLDEAVREAMTRPGPVILADLADNPGGGSPGDSTFILKALLDAGARDIVVGYMVDPLAVQLAVEAGTGARLTLRIGGKLCPLSGDPLDLEVEVGRIIADAVLQVGDGSMAMGAAVAVKGDGFELALCTKRHQTYAPGLFADLGIDLATKHIVVVKSAQHYRAGFAPILASDIVVYAPGVCVGEVTTMTFHNISRPMWPFDPHPLAHEAEREASALV